MLVPYFICTSYVSEVAVADDICYLISLENNLLIITEGVKTKIAHI